MQKLIFNMVALLGLAIIFTSCNPENSPKAREVIYPASNLLNDDYEPGEGWILKWSDEFTERRLAAIGPARYTPMETGIKNGKSIPQVMKIPILIMVAWFWPRIIPVRCMIRLIIHHRGYIQPKAIPGSTASL
jgi:hypothetical protein